ncbi:MAG: FAD-dependent oxidoreductase, partial [Myxococcota bacterium]
MDLSGIAARLSPSRPAVGSEAPVERPAGTATNAQATGVERSSTPSSVAAKLAQVDGVPEKQWSVPSRGAQLERLRDPAERFDVLVIGGGATGAGATLEATRRGLRTACIEAGDFASGTSSRSTKLIHGGVRYLEQAVKELDWGLLSLVREGLHERKAFLEMAPHLCDELRILTPLYNRLEVP